MTTEITWASEEEVRERFHAETLIDPLTQLAIERGMTPNEARVMTRAELIRWLDDHDPRD